MQDRFKFRVWDKENEIWLENGDCSLSMDGELTVLGMDAYGETMFCDSKDYLIEQCSGLKDKNEKLIYEGDICIPAEDMADKAGEVYRAESGAYFIKGKMKNGMEYDFGIYWHHFMYEIIGNIHENADLLGEE